VPVHDMKSILRGRLRVSISWPRSWLIYCNYRGNIRCYCCCYFKFLFTLIY
jgi:hypothetical protein